MHLELWFLNVLQRNSTITQSYAIFYFFAKHGAFKALYLMIDRSHQLSDNFKTKDKIYILLDESESFQEESFPLQNSFPI